MVNEMVVTYGLTGRVLPIASMMPPTVDTTAKATLSAVVTAGEAEICRAAAAGVTMSARTSRAPMIWIAVATARPSVSMNATESRRTGTPRAAATSGSRLAKVRGRHMTVSDMITIADTASSQAIRGVSTATI